MTSTLLFAAGIIGFIIIIISLLSFVSKRQKKQQVQKQDQYFTKAADAFGITVFKKDRLLQRAIGCDEQINRIIFVDYSHQPYRQTLIVLKEIAGSKVIINTDAVTETIKGAEKVTDRFISSVQLKVQFKNTAHAPVLLPVYDFGVDALHDLEHCKQWAGAWNELINKKCS